MKLEGVSMRHALELLANDLPHLTAESSPPPKVVKRSNQQKLPSVLSGSADHQTALRQVIDYYHLLNRENLTWAPNITGQHGAIPQGQLLEMLSLVRGDRDGIVNVLQQWAEIAKARN
jgi:hypothetical protein